MTSSLSAGRLAPHGGSQRVVGMGKRNGRRGSARFSSGSVLGFAGRADGLSRQGHDVVVPLQPDMQTRAMAYAQQFAAFNAAPFGWVEFRSPSWGSWAIAAVVERIGHRRLLCVTGAFSWMRESELVRPPERS